MKQITTIAAMRDYLSPMIKKSQTIGFVPTMGALHEGHLQLIRRAKAENDLSVCSIFVNPIQFNNPEDLANYPRTVAGDLKMLEEISCDVVFLPEAEEIYPAGENPSIQIEFGMLDKVMEGKFRPGHFKGVAIVVKKLFDIIKPTRAYFGKKDYQQLTVILHMVEKLNIPVGIIPCDTVREPDGLAMSSRNLRLTIAERNLAPGIYKVLLKVRKKAGKVPVAELKEWAVKKIEETMGLRVEYFEIAGRESLVPVGKWNAKDRAIAFTAVFLGDVRLIDNIELFS